MKTSRLKNTVIAVLALANVFLLVLLLNGKMQERRAQERAAAQLVRLLASDGVELPASMVPSRKARLASVEPARDLGAETAFAAALLGECGQEDVGGGIYRYVGPAGQCLLRASGAVEAALDRPVESPDKFCESFFSSFGYATVFSDLDDGGGTVVAVRMLSGVRVFNAELTLTFENDRLRAAAGSFVPPAEADGYGEESDGVTALVRFLDYSNGGGEVCTAISDVRSGYLLQTTASTSQRLIPAWYIATDVAQYYVNANTGEVTRATMP